MNTPKTTTKPMRACDIVKKLKARGFDLSRSSGGEAHVGCSQCCACAINGIACHETGCPNQKQG